jgi:hypothetical protein
MLRGEHIVSPFASVRISVNPEQKPNRNDSECPPDWRAQGPTLGDFMLKIRIWLREQTMLFEAFLVAVSFHVLLFPLLWFMGWALPWPKAPPQKVVYEIDLQEWLKAGGAYGPQKLDRWLNDPKYSKPLR